MADARFVYSAITQSDDQLKETTPARGELPADDVIKATVEALEARGIKVTTVDTAADALEAIKAMVPEGSSISLTGSMSLDESGVTAHFQSGKFDDIRSKTFAEEDAAKRAEIRRVDGSVADFHVTSANAVVQTGSIITADATGNRVGPVAMSAKNVVFLASANKIASDMAAGLARLEKVALPLESARSRIAYGVPGSATNNILIVSGANPFGEPGRLQLVLVTKEVIGY